ncbi:venom protease [Nilaparvata lugens]|uniref:venom protease n=1 Tax=Nilaparvata lugens TaxID=108931 RepID=UPI00193DEDDB|nr:venom protease [Nilaparvata lugens]
MLLHCFLVVCVFVGLASVAVVQDKHERLYENDLCDDGSICKKIKDCPGITDLIQQGLRPKVCSFASDESVVLCCPTTTVDYKTDETISEKMCKKYTKTLCLGYVPNIVEGQPVEPKELPFMALIGYGRTTIAWKCGGSLISKRYVLSAAHCNHNGENATWVRLGELDWKSNSDDARPKDYQIVAYIDHPQYNPNENYNDITLYRLDKDVEFNLYIRPICINIAPRNETKAVAAGWGRIGVVERESSKLLKVDLDLWTLDKCSNLSINNVRLPKNLTDDMMCAGTIGGGADTCSGDSGGPLFYAPTQEQQDNECYLLSQIGITSFGTQCGLEPAIYTNVVAYHQWIESIVWPVNGTSDLLIWEN